LSRIRRWLRWSLGLVALFLLFAIAFPLLYAARTEERRAQMPALPPANGGGATFRVYVADWGYHAAIVVEQPRGWHLGPPGEETSRFLEYAWGDKRFYYDSNYWPQSVFATLFLPTESVLYLDGRPDPPQLGGARKVFERTVDSATVRLLLTELERSIRRTRDGRRVEPYAPIRGYAGRFYPAFGSYLWTRSCNWWTVERLLEAGLASSSTGVVFTMQVPGRLRGFARTTSGI